MMYNYPNYPYYPQSYSQPQASGTAQSGGNGLIWVQGEAGAKSYMVAPSSTVMLMDSEQDRFFLKSSDASGMPMPLRVFDYKERIAEPMRAAQDAPKEPHPDYITRDEFNALAAKIEELTAPKKAAKKGDADNG